MAATDEGNTVPLRTRCQPFPLDLFEGFWAPRFIVPGVAAARARFEPRPDDVFLASFPKSGTTWLNALAFSVLTRNLELSFALANNEEDVFAAFPSSRLLATHLPYNLLPERIVTCGRVVYVSSDPKDAVVSQWLFTQKSMPASTGTLQEAFEHFCNDVSVWGAHWRHVLSYWKASQQYPDRVLFLRYEEMLRDPAGNARKLAEFLGRPFSGEEEAAGAVDAVVELCSLVSLRRAEDGRSGVTELGFESGSFRKCAAGDWRNHLTTEMAARLDRVVAGALEQSGFSFENSSA